MKHKIINLMLAFILVLAFVGSVSAVEYFQQRLVNNNSVTRIHSYVLRGSDGTENFIKGGNPLQTYVKYSIYVNSWNSANPNYEIEYCNFFIRYNSNLDNETQVLINVTYTENDADIYDAKYFVTLDEGESMFVDLDCKFLGTQDILTAGDFSVVFPSWECKACQLYEWSLLERDISKAETIGENTVDVMSYIKNLINLNFEIIIVLFWLVLIHTALIPISLIFVGIYWLYLYLRDSIK